MLKELVKERLMAAADDILELFERTIASYQEELCRTREEKERHRQELEAVCKTQIVLHIGDTHKLIGHQEECPPHLQGVSSTLKLEDTQLLHIEEEQEELQFTQEREHFHRLEDTNLTKLPVKTEDHEEKPAEFLQLHLSPSEVNTGAETSSRSLPHYMTTEPDGDHQGGSQAYHLIAPLSDDDDMTSGDGKTTCSVCAKTLPNNGALIRHMRRHTGEKPFRCSVCGRCFSEKSNMVCHMRIHTGEKPFGCSVCGKRFTLNSTFVKHMRTHTGEKPFSCSFCGKTFSRRDVLTLHVRTHTRGKLCNSSVCGKESMTAHGHPRQCSM
uniref:zinc finger protein 774-like n=1 Tax=Doryrhamphus excisus TaxID=161450 RepID=UPI0025ADD74A|nr:zinc finger protein 774-like [Doryrhamphus excisus]